MAVVSTITKLYGKAVFMDHTRTLDSVPATQKDPVKEYAAGIGVDVNGAPVPSGYYVETIDDTLTAGKITQAQHFEILELNPNMPHRAAAAEAPIA